MNLVDTLPLASVRGGGRNPFEDEEVESLQFKVDEGSFRMSEVTPKIFTHHALPSTPIVLVKILPIVQP